MELYEHQPCVHASSTGSGREGDILCDGEEVLGTHTARPQIKIRFYLNKKIFIFVPQTYLQYLLYLKRGIF